MEVSMIIFIALFIFFLMIIFGGKSVAPKPQEMDAESIMSRIYIESKWIYRYKNLNYEAREKDDLKKKFLEKEEYLNQLQKHFEKLLDIKGDEDMKKIMMRQIQLIRTLCLPVDHAFEQALSESKHDEFKWLSKEEDWMRPMLKKQQELILSGMNPNKATDKAREWAIKNDPSILDKLLVKPKK